MKPRSIVAGALVAALGIGGVAWATQNRPRPLSYTTGLVAAGSITQELTSTGVVRRPGQQSLSFDTAGLITGLSVKVGDSVRAGQALATVDPAPLQVSLLQAQASLAQARAVLDADTVAKDNGGTTVALPSSLLPAGGSGASSGLPSGAAGLPTGGSLPGMTGATPATPAYALALQASLTKLQTTVATQQAACAPVYAVIGQLQEVQAQLPTTLPTSLPTHPGHSASPSPSADPSNPPSATPSASPSDAPSPSQTPTDPVSPDPSPSPSPTTSPSPSPTGEPDPSPSADASPGSARGFSGPAPSAMPTVLPSAWASLSVEEAKKLAGQLSACTDSILALAGAEAEAGQAILTAAAGMQQATAAAQQQLAAAQQQMVAAAQAAAQQAAAEAMAQAQAQLAAQAQRALGGQVTDATLATDRARVLQAEQSVTRAERALAASTLTSPADGIVGAVSLVPGESSAGRSIVVVGPGLAEITVEVPLRVRDLVSAGQPVDVGLVGADPSLKGQVASVSVLPTSSSTNPTYTAVVAVDDPTLLLNTGAKAQVTLPLRSVTDVVTVPLSAVTKTTDTTGTVRVVADEYADTAETVQVTTGAWGGGRIEIRSGLQPGQRVVLADRRLPVPGGLQQYQPSTPTPTPTPTATRR